MKTQLITLAAAARYLGICDPTARRILKDHGVLVATCTPGRARKRYPLSIIENIAARGTGVAPKVHAAYVVTETLRP